ncbi:hypothetical protein CPLU01_13580 [Colletotrichum plurivorum]|uniref:Uncharacterized protein n=1 Tax=Colletotrichum plurivorum TaxID=2175906 RepID=A0A8H6N200_9PEZI|nr:hypothetical protein CPLU01_13580 [Colletotrichum plurivorum]
MIARVGWACLDGPPVPVLGLQASRWWCTWGKGAETMIIEFTGKIDEEPVCWRLQRLSLQSINQPGRVTNRASDRATGRFLEVPRPPDKLESWGQGWELSPLGVWVHGRGRVSLPLVESFWKCIRRDWPAGPGRSTHGQIVGNLGSQEDFQALHSPLPRDRPSDSRCGRYTKWTTTRRQLGSTVQTGARLCLHAASDRYPPRQRLAQAKLRTASRHAG